MSGQGAAEQTDNGRRLLVVDDSPVSRQVAVVLLKKAGYWAEAVADGEAALAALAVTRYDLVLMDLHMPGLDGPATTRRIRAGLEGVLNPRVPVIAVTASNLSTELQGCLAAGMNAHIVKPFQLEQLQALLDLILRHSSVVTPSHRMPAPPPATDEPFACGELLEHLGGDRELFAKLVAESLADLPLRLDKLRQLLTERDAPGARQAAHVIVGMAGYLCARPLKDAARTLKKELAAGCIHSLDELYAVVENKLWELVGALRTLGYV